MIAEMSSIAVPPALANEVALLLASEGIEAAVRREDDAVVVVVADRDSARAVRLVAEEYPDGLTDAAPRRATRPAAPIADGWFGRGSWVLFALVTMCVAVYAREEL